MWKKSYLEIQPVIILIMILRSTFIREIPLYNHCNWKDHLSAAVFAKFKK